MQRRSPETLEIYPGTNISYIAKGHDISSAVLLGVGQNGKNLQRVSETLTDNTAVIEALPYHQIPLDSLEALCLDALKQIFHRLSPDAPIHLIAESQAAPIAVLSATEQPERFRSITLIAPLGFNKSSLGHTPEARYKELMRRSRKFWSHPNQSLRLRANRDTMFEIARRSFLAVQRLRADYINGAGQDVVEPAKKLAEHMPVRIIADRKDSLFPYDEIKRTIGESAITLEEANLGSHINRATPKGIAQLQQIIASLHE